MQPLGIKDYTITLPPTEHYYNGEQKCVDNWILLSCELSTLTHILPPVFYSSRKPCPQLKTQELI